VRPHECDSQPGGHHVIAEHRRSRGSVKPEAPSGDGAKRSGLTGPRAAGQSRVVMAAVHATFAHVSELARRSRRAGGRGGRRWRSSAAAVQNSERMRAHLYEREFRAKPVSGADRPRERRRARRRIVRRTRQVSGAGAVPPDERDLRLGRERPPPTGPWGEEGGMAEGVAHAPLVADGDADTARTRTRAA
jgi:hypothetical protein